MIRWRSGTVQSVRAEWAGVREVVVTVAGEPDCRALAYVSLVGQPEPGDRVLLNTTALAQGLGTGGHALVVAIPDRLPADPDGPGHLVKARYTPSQASVLGVDEQESPHHRVVAEATSLDGIPVVVADLHSALPAIVAGIRADAPAARIAYVMTDGGALPMWYSRTVAALRPLLCGTVSTGQSFGGDLESVTVHTGLLAARHVLLADVIVVTQGPGNLGTGTPWGFSGVVAGEVVNAVAVLGGRAVGALRISDADPRERHRGVSHHSLTAFGRVALADVDLVVPSGLPDALALAVAGDLASMARVQPTVTVPVDGLAAALRSLPVGLSTMGRGLDADLWYFLGSAVAGRHAANLIKS
ncbi:MAG: hypothetical protein JWM76_1538 [Pseudonocardiales bacterium]|nr:hypothetical protein [Pseudonocardiales bacterium]